MTDHCAICPSTPYFFLICVLLPTSEFKKPGKFLKFFIDTAVQKRVVFCHFTVRMSVFLRPAKFSEIFSKKESYAW